MTTRSGPYLTGTFLFHGKALPDSPTWGMSLAAAGNMSFRWGEENPVRDAFLSKIACGKDVAAVELVHSKTVHAAACAKELSGKQGDGIVTTNRSLVPVVTVADCMPVFLYDPGSGVFGTLHSGWKGTGIVKEAILLAERTYHADRRNFCVVMGPHIHSCCYAVDEERARFFREMFCPECVEVRDGTAYLSLARANKAVLSDMGVPDGNILCCDECTACDVRFGSFRRETAGLLPGTPMEIRRKHFTVQAAWVTW